MSREPQQVLTKEDKAPIGADVAIAGGGPAALITALNYVRVGKRAVIVTKDSKLMPKLAERDEEALHCTSAIAPMRGWMGFHYLSDPKTIDCILEASFAYMQRFPVLAQKMKRSRTDYHFSKNSTYEWEAAQAGLQHLKATYETHYKDKKSDAIRHFLPPPDQLFRVKDPKECQLSFPQADIDKILYTIVTSEGLLPVELIKTELGEGLESAQKAGLLRVLKHTAVEGIVSGLSGAYHYVMCQDLDSAEKTLLAAPVVNLFTWDNTPNLLARHTFVKTPKGDVLAVTAPRMGVRVKQILYGWIDKSKVGSFSERTLRSGKRFFDLDVPATPGIQSSFFGYNFEDGCMLAIDDAKERPCPDGSGRLGYRFRATVAEYTNRLAIDDDGSDAVQAKIKACYDDVDKKADIERSILFEILRRFQLDNKSLICEGSHLGTVMTGAMGIDSKPQVSRSQAPSRLSVSQAAFPAAAAAASAAARASTHGQGSLFHSEVTRPGKRHELAKDSPVSAKRAKQMTLGPGVERVKAVMSGQGGPLNKRQALYVELVRQGANPDDVPDGAIRRGPITAAFSIKALNAVLVSRQVIALCREVIVANEHAHQAHSSASEEHAVKINTLVSCLHATCYRQGGSGNLGYHTEPGNEAERKLLHPVDAPKEAELGLCPLSASQSGEYRDMRRDWFPGSKTPGVGRNSAGFYFQTPSGSPLLRPETPHTPTGPGSGLGFPL